MDIAVITPSVPRRTRMLQECIESVLAQTYPVKEHLYEVDVHREGPATIRNRLVKKTKASWIAFLDDDDILYPNHFEMHAPYMDNYDVIFSWAYFIDSNGKQLFDSKVDVERILGGTNTLPITATVRAEAFKAVDGFNETVRFEDWYLWKSLIEYGARFAPPIETVTWEYRTGHGNRNDYE